MLSQSISIMSTTMNTHRFLSLTLLGKRPNDNSVTQNEPTRPLNSNGQDESPTVSTHVNEKGSARDLIRRITSTSSLESSPNPQDGHNDCGGDDDDRDLINEDDYFDFIFENHYALRDEVDIYRKKGCKFMTRRGREVNNVNS
mmetsp:Transcript_6614/g.13298  ORF Transcript_6614/g.13298 Transcript_6614/m.13298 type:complete len:143 (-) Transcript_6614:136-564(-)